MGMTCDKVYKIYLHIWQVFERHSVWPGALLGTEAKLANNTLPALEELGVC